MPIPRTPASETLTPLPCRTTAFLLVGHLSAQLSPPAEEALGRGVDDPEQWVVRGRRREHLAHMTTVYRKAAGGERGEHFGERVEY